MVGLDGWDGWIGRMDRMDGWDGWIGWMDRKKLMFLSGTLPAGFFFVRKDIFWKKVIFEKT